MPKPDGGSILPAFDWVENRREPGMRLRDYFAGQALAGLCADDDTEHDVNHRGRAKQAWAIADAMIETRDE